MLVNNLKIKMQCDNIEVNQLLFGHYPFDNLEQLIQLLKNLESKMGYTAFNVSFNVYDFEETIDKAEGK